MREEYVYRERQVGWAIVLRRDVKRFRLGSGDVAGLLRALVLAPRL